MVASEEMMVVEGIRGGIIERGCGSELDDIQLITGQILLRMKAMGREKLCDMEQQELYYYAKTLKEVGGVAKMLIDIDRGSAEKEDDVLGKLLDRVMGKE